GRIGGSGDRHTLIGDRSIRSSFGKLADQPPIREVIVEDDRIPIATRLASAAETSPDGRDAIRSEDGIRGDLVEDLKALVDDLNVLGLAHGAVGIRWRAVAAHAWKRDAVEVVHRG